MKNFFDAFISYGRADSKTFAIKLNQRLTSVGLKVWFDQEDIPLAVDYQEQINDGIEKAHNFIFIIAPHSVNSPYCLKEIELAIKHNKRIIPLLHVEEISRETWQLRNPHQTEADWQEYQAKKLHSSHPNMHPTIKKINWVYFRENLDDFEAYAAGLLEIFDRHKDYVQKHTNLLVQAKDWERNQKQNNYLLIGQERQEAEKWLKHRFTDELPPCLPTDLQCEFMQSHQILKHIYGKLNPPAYPDELSGKIVKFDQSEFIQADNTSMSKEAYAYIPKACETESCKVHVAIHGCLQGAAVIGDTYYDTTGYNEIADTNNIIVLYPQVEPSQPIPYNPQGCWDFWGYSSVDPENPVFYTRESPQMKAIVGMLKRLAEPYSATIP